MITRTPADRVDLITPHRTGLLAAGRRAPTGFDAVAHLVHERQRYAGRPAQCAGPQLPVVCDELLGHYEAQVGARPRPRNGSVEAMSRAALTKIPMT